ncbi:MAG: mechanosensitive ion channel family protein [Clostridia bacterium]|nr:mechanosensitive ion channel family protein [Clostridia bacterium]
MKKHIRRSFISLLFCAAIFAAEYVMMQFFTISDNLAALMVKLRWFFIMLFCVILVSTLLGALISKFSSRSQRNKTMSSLLLSLLSYIEAIVIVIWGLTIFGVDTGALFAGLGVVSLIVGFGAQSLIGDIVTGIFILFEGQYNIDDVIEIDGFKGVVKSIGIRTVSITDAAGTVKIVNNSDIKNVQNRTCTLLAATCDIGISYNESIEKAEKVISETLPLIKAKCGDDIVEGPSYLGVEELGDSAVVLRIIAKVHDDENMRIYSVRRILNREIKLAFDKSGIEIPFPQVVVHKADN